MPKILLIVLLVFCSACQPKLNLVEPSPGRTLESYQAVGQKMMVVTPNRQATEVGLNILKKGGTAIDAAIAVSFALGVLRPQSTGLGGGGFMLSYDAKKKKSVAFDFREYAPLKATPDMYVKNGVLEPKLAQEGGLAVAVPRLVAGLGDIYDLYASKKIPWPELIQPSIDLALQGFAVYPHLANALENEKEVLARFDSSKKIFLPGGAAPKEGETLVQKDLAKTLSIIAQKGWSGFYQGQIAANVIRSVQLAGGIMTIDDLWRVEPIETAPVESTYKGYKIVSMPPPSSGGVTLMETLNILENFPISRQGPYNPKTVHEVAEAMKRAFLDRARYLGDPKFVKMPLKGLLSKKYAEELADSIDTKKAIPSIRLSPLESNSGLNESTTHFSIVDEEGNAVASTQTINNYFGSGLVAAGTGVVLNDEMDDFAIQPGVANAYGLVGGEANAIAPGKKPLSSMAPTFVFNPKGELVMALGSPGGPKIITAVLHTLLNRIAFKVKPLEAVAAKRYHHQWIPDVLEYESGIFSPKLLDRLVRMGHHPKEVKAPWLVMLIARSNQGWIGVSDPRGVGTALGE
ncbi:MAG: gamma-glutamyltransferase [Deltaproteobacteria bacterium]|nr:gamma-glutamyltransferase [Deltaproteobacteria bacterium]